MAPESKSEKSDIADKPSVTLPGTVEKIIPAINPEEPDKAQVTVEGAEHLYREIRVDNVLEDEKGRKVGLKPGAHVEVTIEAEPSATVPKPSGSTQPDKKR